MSDTIDANTLGECWLKCIDTVIKKGSIFYDEDVKIKEILGLQIKISSPNTSDEIISKFGDQEVILHTLKKFSKGIVMENRPFTYGDLIYNKNGVDQFEWLVDRLNNKKETKSATICLLKEGAIDDNLPCLNTIDAKIRDGRLNLQFFFRSQNVFGRQYANLLAIAKLQADLAGRLLEQEGEYDPIDNPQGWTLINFPAIQNKPPSELDPRAEGEPLWPERHSLSKLLEIKERTPTVFESMYQQNPQPSQGLMYEEFTCYTELPYRSQSVAYIDAADSGADYLCALFYKEAEEGNYIIDVLYTKEPMEVTETTLTYMLQQHQVERCHIESNNGGGLFVSNLQQRAYDMGNRLTRFYPFHQGQNKAARIFAASASVQKLIKMPLDWKKRFPKFARDLTGYLRVGSNAHDDAPDALTGSIECRQPPKKVDLAAMFGLR